MPQWKVKEGTQAKHDGKLYAAGESFSATQAQIDAGGLGGLVDEAGGWKLAPKAPNKAQKPSANKSQKPSANK